jgi:hypothetical protein
LDLRHRACEVALGGECSNPLAAAATSPYHRSLPPPPPPSSPPPPLTFPHCSTLRPTLPTPVFTQAQGRLDVRQTSIAGRSRILGGLIPSLGYELFSTAHPQRYSATGETLNYHLELRAVDGGLAHIAATTVVKKAGVFLCVLVWVCGGRGGGGVGEGGREDGLSPAVFVDVGDAELSLELRAVGGGRPGAYRCHRGCVSARRVWGGGGGGAGRNCGAPYYPYGPPPACTPESLQYTSFPSLLAHPP